MSFSARLLRLRPRTSAAIVFVLTTSYVTQRTPLRNDSGHGPRSPGARSTPVRDRHRDAVSQKRENFSQQPSAKSTRDGNNALLFEDDDTAAWESISSHFNNARLAIKAIDWSEVGDTITGHVIPSWAKLLPGYVEKLQNEIDMAPGSLAEEIWEEAQDPTVNPEILDRAKVRIGKELCIEEKDFVRRRKEHTTKALARYLDIPETDIDPDDVPTIAICGSGGGLRALVSGCSSYMSAQEAGLFDCATYTAGVSGSCWLQALLHSSIGQGRIEKVLEHLKRRIGVHIAYPPDALELLTRAPTNKFLLAGYVEKLKGDAKGDFGIVDVYGLLLAARLLVPRGDLAVNVNDLKLSNQKRYLESGSNPLPIYTAVRHEIPVEEHKSKEEHGDSNHRAVLEKAKKEAWFQWFEFTPYELFCEELMAGIPSWGVGRKFENGKSIVLSNDLGLPEVRVPLLLGIWGSAFCATLSHYYKEVRPVVKGLAGFGGLDELMGEKDQDLIKVHPIEPGSIPNFAVGLGKKLPDTCPKSVSKDEHLQLMDAGMSNNLPIYPLLRQGRDVDVIVCFDASADVKMDNWLSVADGYAKQRKIKGWPIGAGWPKKNDSKEVPEEKMDGTNVQEHDDSDHENQKKDQDDKQSDLGYCNVWVGQTLERESAEEPPPSKRVDPDADWSLLNTDGIAVIYFPFLANPKVEGVDPMKSDFMSTWNFIYSPSDIEKVVSLARTNFDEGREQTRNTVRAVYERKKAKRLEREEREKSRKWERHLKHAGDHFR